MAPPRPVQRSVRETIWFKLLVSLAIIAAIAGAVARVDFRRDLSFLNVKLLSGSPEGHYHLVAQQMSEFAAREHGKLVNVASDGTVDNLQKLSAGRSACAVQFALVQDGADFPTNPPLQLIGRLPHAETIFFLGKRADEIEQYAQLKGLKIGVGPEASGTARVAHELFDSADFKSLSILLSNHPLNEQIEQAASGQLDLAMFVMDEDGPLIQNAVREKGLQIVGFPHAQVLARQVAHVRTGVITAGQFDPVRMLPPKDKDVLQVETLVVSNGCASRSQTIGVMDALSQVYPDFIRHNRGTANTTGLRMASTAKSYFEAEGPEVFDEYAPWLVDLMPPGNWVYIVTGVSILFNVMGFGHRFRLWQLDSKRVKLDIEMSKFFGAAATLKDVERLEPTAQMRGSEVQEGIRELIGRLEKLAATARKQSLSVLVPMGQEMAYRYQEGLMHETIAVLRAFLARCARAEAATVARAS
jgi:TRAP-type uncharacterized transport system substrate-binding protein